MGARDILASIMSPGGGGAPVGADAYQQLLQQNMQRYHGDRDQAVRSANIAGGFGNSTAQRFMHGGGGGGDSWGGGLGGSGLDPMVTDAISTPRPDVAPAPGPALPDPGSIGSGIPLPTTPIVGAPVPADRPVDPGIGSGIPMPTTPMQAPIPADRPQVPIPTPRPGGVTLGGGVDAPLTNPNRTRMSGEQYNLARRRKAKKKKA